jgi:hypothetical protein
LAQVVTAGLSSIPPGLIYTLSRTVIAGETIVDFDYTQPGNGVEDAAGNDLATFLNQQALVTNNSTSDATAPVLTNVTDVKTGTTTATIGVDTDEGNGTLYWAVSTNTTRSIAQIKAGTGCAQFSSVAVSSTGTKTVNVTGLTAATTYYAHFTQTDTSNNDATAVNGDGFTTDAVPDTTAPILSAPVDDNAGETDAALTVDTDEGNGTLYWVISTSSSAPSKAQVKAGQMHTGAAAADSGSQAVSGTGTQTITGESGLTAETTYYAHFMHEDSSTNQSDVVSGNGFTTDAAASGDANWTSVELMLAALAGTSGGTTSNGPDAGTTITDQGPDARGNMTRSGAAWEDTNPPTGLDTSVQMTANTHYFRLSTSLSFAADFTWECYFRADAVGSDQVVIYVNNDTIMLDSTAVMQYIVDGTIRITGTTTVSTNTWYHVAVSRSGSDIKLFLNGTQEGSTYSSAASIGGDWVWIANNNVANAGFVGRMAGVRLTQAARYTGSFTPPTFPYPTSA